MTLKPNTPDLEFSDPQLPRENLPLDTPPQQWTKDQACKVVKHDFERAAAWRSSNIEPKWMEAMDTYLATQPASTYWKGTRTPKANLQSFQAFQQINALRPQVLDALTGSDLDFDVEAETPGVSFTQVHGVRSLISYQLRNLGSLVKFQSFRGLLDKTTEDGMVLGNGVFEYGWDGPRDVMVPKWEQVPEIMSRPHPMVPGLMLHEPTGRIGNQKTYIADRVSHFFADPCEQVDFYIDPLIKGTNVQMAEFCVRRRMMSIAQLSEYRGKEGFDVPDDLELYRLSQKKFSSEGDTTRDYFQSAQGVNTPTLNGDQSIDPRLARVEVLRYWQKGRHVWLLGRKHVMVNGPNYYQVLPFFNWCYVNKPGSFYGFSIPELLRGDQALIRTLMNGRVDELALILHPPTITKRGTFRSASQSKFGPGENWEADDPGKDIVRMEMGNVTQGASEEINAAENRGQKKTGVTDLAVLGTPSSGGNSANRTATGVQAQTNASNSRVHGLVATIEDTCVGPMLDQAWELCKMYLTPEDVGKVIGQPDNPDMAVDILNADPRFKMKTANNMKMRAGMQNGGLQQLTQYVLNPEIQTLIGEQQGLVLDVPQFTEFYLDVYGVKAFQLFRPMTPQEQQAKQQRQQAPAQENQALQSARLEQMSQDAHQRDDAKLLSDVLSAIIPALINNGLLHNPMGLEAPAQIEARRLDAEIDGGQMESQPAQ